MSTISVTNIILEIVNNKPGIKGTELVAEIVSEIYSKGQQVVSETLPDFINEMVKSGDIVEVEYVLPTMAYRIKSLYFPKNTDVTVVVVDQPIDVSHVIRKKQL